MNTDSFPLRPRKILQKFSKDKLDESRGMSAKAKLDWLEEINLLYWKAEAGRRAA